MKKIVVNNVLKEYNYIKKGQWWYLENKVTENLMILMVFIKVNLILIGKLVMEYKFIEMEVNTKVNGLEIKKMVKE